MAGELAQPPAEAKPNVSFACCGVADRAFDLDAGRRPFCCAPLRDPDPGKEVVIPVVKSHAKARAEKSAAIEELAEKLARAEIAVLTEYRGLSVANLHDLRSRLRQAGVEYLVTKNTLVRFAAERTGRTSIVQDLDGPTAIAFGSDPVMAAKALQDYVRTNKLLILKAAVLGDRRLEPRDVEQLASLPPAEELRARTFGMIVSPLQRTVSILAAPLASLARVLDAYRKQLEEAAGGAATEGGDMATVDELVQNLSDLKVLDLANHVKQLEEKWGVSAAAVAAPVAAAAAGGPAPAAAAVEEKTEFDVILQNFGDKKIEVIKVVRELTSLGLKEAKDLVEAAPKPVLEGAAKDVANNAAQKLRAAGATVEVK
jgi:large subunit ribosomal protein L7/L12